MVRQTLQAVKTLFDRNTRTAVMKLSFAISLLFHLGLVLAVQKALPFHFTIEPVRAYRVELIRPPVDLSEAEEGSGANLAKIGAPSRTPPENTEDTISLDTSDKRYSSYASVIKSVLMKHWKYPVKAREDLIEGKLLALFTLNRRGTLVDVRILTSSGSDILDREAVRAVRSAAPFPAFPSSVSVARLHVKAKFDYRLTTQ